MQRVSSESLSLWALFQKIKALEGSEIELVMSSVSPLLENLLALKILRDQLLSFGKKITFIFEDQSFADLVLLLNGLPSDLLTPAVPKDLSAKAAVSTPGPRSIFRFPILSWSRPKFKINRALFFLLLPLFIFLGGISALYFFSQAKISLFLNSESLPKTIDVWALPSADTVSEDPPTIPALEISTSLQKSESSPSSGKKEVGEKATGSLTIYNKTASSVDFPAATVLAKGRVNGDDLRFLTKDKVEVPARTADATAVSGYQPGTASVLVSAEKLGEEYNLLAGETFSVGVKPTSDFIAQNTSDLTGGSRRQVVVVTLEDQRKLYDQLLTHLKEELKKNTLAKVVAGQVLDEESITYETVVKSFDHGVGDEADRLTLSLEVRTKALAFLKSDLDNLSARLLSAFVPDGYELFGGEQTVEIDQTQSVDGKLKILARAKGFIVPKIDGLEITRKLTGQNISFAKNYLEGLTKINSFSMERSPDLSFFPFLPFRAQNLKVEIVRK